MNTTAVYFFYKMYHQDLLQTKKLPILTKCNIITIISVSSILCLTLILPNLFNLSNTFRITSLHH